MADLFLVGPSRISLVPSQFMRAIGLALPRRSIEFCRQLRLEATARVFELSFSPRHVGQHCVQPLWTQNQEPEHKHEQNFRAKTHDSLLG